MKYLGILAASATALIAVTGCSSGATDTAAPAGSMTATTRPAPATSPAMADGPFGAACSAVPADGEGSFTGMADDPVATAASNNPVLSTLVTAVKKAGLVDTLNSAKDVTVFAPTNDAFAAIPKATLDKVLADKETLTKILTYHVVAGKQAPADLASADLKTLQGGTLSVKGSGESYTVNEAGVVCGNVPTANATVYIIDKVLMPK
ncbi:putative surface protein with fasciclin (FAS1) repeats [Nonomuraea endophytica]|uniref:Putative surface protein with fasciclin (FAS1) repeats n=2 Tax=Nonomuraea endophytica TaxID=714136 RepID=A0A7W8ACY2_9ACTN|nr:fasciclin domain-containing protein [Nonomuraea endophytica]MBB5083987.1 putative surface protein with fasciclin (FAS1) repeats [Nonomuraea endophytica]